MKAGASDAIIFSLFCLLLFCTGCADSTEPDDGNTVFYQNPGCVNKAAVLDSCFSYTFTDKLVVEFCVEGNCCPDSNRFIFTQDITADTINITVTDIEANLCRCFCNYLLHYESAGLPLNSYQYNVYVRHGSGITLLYSNLVFRDIR